MTELNRPVHRTSSALRHEAGKTRNIIISLSPPAYIGLRLSGTKTTYWLDAEVAYEVAVKAMMQQIEREARKIKKQEGITLASARVKASKQIARWSRSLTKG